MKITPSNDPVHAPELDGALAWLNIHRPLSMRELRGQVVILDFWTYCCINCMHVVPTLRELERRYRDQPLVVIGIHSGKFSAERDPERIAAAIGRYGVEHPVAVDDDMLIWARYAIRSWPTLVVVRPDGRIAAVAPGEPALETIDAFIAGVLAEARESGTLAERPPVLDAAPPQDREPLCYPGKAVVLPDGRLAISDSGHHRVIVCERDGEVRQVFGSGVRGLADGPSDEAAFDDPQGLCWHPTPGSSPEASSTGAIYVADTRNHAIRRLNLEAGTVTTVAGTGQLGLGAPERVASARKVALRSPWDVCSVGDAIYVAMAGNHQLWRFWPDRGDIEVYAGSGVEALIDGDVKKSAWAQPSGLCEKDGILYVADSETSAVRAVDLERGMVTTLAGLGLFDYGDGEGDTDAALLQHCLSVAVDSSGVFIADTYNGKIKRWTARDGGLHGTSSAQRPSADGDICTLLDGLHEPGSVAVAPDGALIIADTNAHRLLEIQGDREIEIAVRGAPRARQGALAPPARGEAPESGVDGWFTTLLELPENVGLGAGDGSLSIIMQTPAGTALAAGSPLSIAVEVSRRSDLLTLPRSAFSLTTRGGRSQIVSIDVHVLALDEQLVDAELVATVDYIACNETDQAACSPGRLHLRVPVRLLSEGGARQLEYGVDLGAYSDGD